MKLLRNLLLSLLLLTVLAVPVLAGEEPAFDGYIVKLSDNAPRLFFTEDRDLLWVETLEEAQEIPEDWVEYIEPSYTIYLLGEEETLTDTYYTDQWWMPAIDGLAAQKAGLTGSGVTVGFVDSGIRATHEDLKAENISGENFYSGDKGSYTSESSGHGTFCAGIVAAQQDNGKGLAGLAPDVTLRMYRAFKGTDGYPLDVAKAIRQAADDGCQVLNLSFGTTDDMQTIREAVEYAAGKGVILIAAVGNSGTTQKMYPAAYDCVIGVGSVSPGLTLSGFSHRNDSVFVTAPGGKMIGLGYTADNSYRLDADATANSGTSYAAPVVTALAALALEADPDLTADSFRLLLKNTVQDAGAEGYDTSYGHGVVNVARFVEKLNPSLTVKAEGTFLCVTQEDSVLLIGVYNPEGKLEKLEYRAVSAGVHEVEYNPSEGIVRIFLLSQTTLSPLCINLMP